MNLPRFRYVVISAARLVPIAGAAALCIGTVPTALASDHCTAYGPGFTSVEGSDTCIRIGGRVRVEAGTGMTASSANNGWASGGTRPASLHSSSGEALSNTVNGADFGRSHLRLPQGALGYADPSH
jgi:hypothetical protein